MFPRRAVASVIGIGGFAGALGGWLFQRATGRILDHNGNNYAPIFVVCGLAYVSAWIIIHVLAPTLQPARLAVTPEPLPLEKIDRKSTRLESSHLVISYAGLCLVKKH